MPATPPTRHGRTTAEHRPAPSLRLTPPPPPSAAASVPPERIRQRAFEIFQARRGAPGDPLTDWLQAERELCHQASAAGRTETRGEILMHDDE